MGRRRRENDDRAGALAEAHASAEKDRRAICLQRWPGILAATRALLTAYNDGAGEELLTATEQNGADDPCVTIASRGSAQGQHHHLSRWRRTSCAHTSGIGRRGQSSWRSASHRLLAQRSRHGGLSAAGLDGPAMSQIMGKPTGWRHAREITADLLIATALIWTPPLLLGAVVAVLTRVF